MYNFKIQTSKYPEIAPYIYLAKLAAYGFDPKSLKYILQIYGIFQKILSGVHQGSNLGVIIFLLMTYFYFCK